MAVSGPQQFDPAFFSVAADGTVGVKTTGASTPPLVINQAAGTPANAPPTGTPIWVIGDAAGEASPMLEGFGTGVNPGIIARRARGTAAAPTAVQAFDLLNYIGSNGRGATLYGAGPAVNMRALENWTDTANGSSILFQTAATGSATVTGRLDIRQGVIIGASGPTITATSDPGPGALVLNANTVAPPAGQTPNLYVVGADGGGNQIVMDGFGSPSQNQFLVRKARGTAGSPTAIQNGDYLLQILTQGRGATGYNTFGRANILLSATENWTDTAQGTALTLQTTPTGTAATVNSLQLQGNTATFSGDIVIPAGKALWLNGATTNPGRVVCDGNNVIITAGSPSGGCVVQNSAASANILIVNANGDLAISGSNAVKASGTTWANPSSRDLKTNIQPYDKGLEAVLALNPSVYEFSADSGIEAPGSHIGLVHDETSHMPEMHRTLTIGGTPDAPGREVDGLDCSAVTWALVNALKTVAARLDALEAKGSA